MRASYLLSWILAFRLGCFKLSLLKLPWGIQTRKKSWLLLVRSNIVFVLLGDCESVRLYLIVVFAEHLVYQFIHFFNYQLFRLTSSPFDLRSLQFFIALGIPAFDHVSVERILEHYFLVSILIIFILMQRDFLQNEDIRNSASSLFGRFLITISSVSWSKIRSGSSLFERCQLNMFGTHKVWAQVIWKRCVNMTDCGRLEVLANNFWCIGARGRIKLILFDLA